MQAMETEGKKGVALMKAKGQRAKEEAERQLFGAAHLERSSNSIRNAWICKPSRGGKGQGIKIFTTAEELMEFVDAHEKGAFVVQHYIERPLLLPGARKFDIRVWAIAHATPEIPCRLYLYREVASLHVCAHRGRFLADSPRGVPAGGAPDLIDCLRPGQPRGRFRAPH